MFADTFHHQTADDTPISNTSQQHIDDNTLQEVDAAPPIGSVAPALSVPATNSRLVDKLVREAAQGHLQAINAILATNPELVRVLL